MQSLICQGASFFLVFGFAFLASDRSSHDMILVSCSVPCWNKGVTSLQTHISLYAVTKALRICNMSSLSSVMNNEIQRLSATSTPRWSIFERNSVSSQERPACFLPAPGFFCNSREKVGMLPGGTTSHEGETTTKFNFEWRQTSSMFGVFFVGQQVIQTDIVPKWWFNGDVLHLQLLWKLNRYVDRYVYYIYR